MRERAACSTRKPACGSSSGSRKIRARPCKCSCATGALMAMNSPPTARFTAEQIDPLFYTRIERVVRKDGAVTLGNKLMEVNLALRALKVELRFDPVLFDRV